MRYVTMVALGALVVGLPACSCRRLRERIMEKAVESSDKEGKTKANFDLGKGTFEIKNEKGEKITLTGSGDKGTFVVKNEKGEKLSFSSGGNVKLPDEWPKDLPAPPEGKLISVMVANQGGMVSYQSPKTPAVLHAYYAKVLPEQGWKVVSTMQFPVGSTFVVKKDPKRSATVTVAGDQGKDKPTVVNLTTGTK